MTQAHRIGRVDAFVQSTDKNFMVPVGGAVVASSSEAFIKDVAQIYPGQIYYYYTLLVYYPVYYYYLLVYYQVYYYNFAGILSGILLFCLYTVSIIFLYTY